MSVQRRNMDIEEVHVEKKVDSSFVASTFIKYVAYILGILYFIANYILPKL